MSDQSIAAEIKDIATIGETVVVQRCWLESLADKVEALEFAKATETGHRKRLEAQLAEEDALLKSVEGKNKELMSACINKDKRIAELEQMVDSQREVMTIGQGAVNALLIAKDKRIAELEAELAKRDK